MSLSGTEADASTTSFTTTAAADSTENYFSSSPSIAWLASATTKQQQQQEHQQNSFATFLSSPTADDVDYSSIEQEETGARSTLPSRTAPVTSFPCSPLSSSSFPSELLLDSSSSSSTSPASSSTSGWLHVSQLAVASPLDAYTSTSTSPSLEYSSSSYHSSATFPDTAALAGKSLRDAASTTTEAATTALLDPFHNYSDSSTFSEAWEENNWFHVAAMCFKGFIFSTIIIGAVLGNALVIISVRRNRKLR